MSEQREPERPNAVDEAEERSGLKRPNDEVKDLASPADTGEKVRGGFSKIEWEYKDEGRTNA